MRPFYSGGENKRESGGERGNPTPATETHLQWKTDVMYFTHTLNHALVHLCIYILNPPSSPPQEWWENGSWLQDPGWLRAASGSCTERWTGPLASQQPPLICATARPVLASLDIQSTRTCHQKPFEPSGLTSGGHCILWLLDIHQLFPVNATPCFFVKSIINALFVKFTRRVKNQGNTDVSVCE